MNLILLSTSNCVKCRSMAPALEEFCSDHCIGYQKVDAMKEGLELVQTYNIRSVPAVFLYNGEGSLVKHFIGDFSLSDITRFYSEIVQK